MLGVLRAYGRVVDGTEEDGLVVRVGEAFALAVNGELRALAPFGAGSWCPYGNYEESVSMSGIRKVGSSIPGLIDISVVEASTSKMLKCY